MRARRGSRLNSRTSYHRSWPNRVDVRAGAHNVRHHRPDYLLAVLTLLLAVVGLIVIYSISPALAAMGRVSGSYYVEKQLLAIGLAIVAFVVAGKIPLATWRRLMRPLMVLAAFATLLALVMPVNANYPAHRWVRMGGLSFQSVELLKFALLMWLASLLTKDSSNDRLRKAGDIFKPLGIALLGVGVIVAGLQSDLGSAGVILMMMVAMAYVSGVQFKKIAIFGCVIVLIASLAVVISPYRRARLETYLNPAQSCQTAKGYQACQALISVGSGGFFGLGLGRSVQAYGYLPEASNDSIFAIYAEKFGFIGCLFLLALFLTLFLRIKTVAERAPDDFSRLVATGVLAWVAVETTINIGGMVGLLPLKGITLPFISYGGTSMIFSAAAMGLVFQISRYTSFSSVRIRAGGKEKTDGNHSDRRRVGRSRYATSSYRR